MEPQKRYSYIRHTVPKDLPNVERSFGEYFKEVIFYDGRILPWYYMSNFGRLYSVTYNRLISQYLDQGGYYRVTIVIDQVGHTCFTGVHKLELMTFWPITNEDGLFVPNHKDGNKTNNFLGNLEWVTVSQNTRHALDTGLSNCKCENNSRSYLSNETIHYICKMMEEGKSNSYILDELDYPYGTERNRVAAILRLIHRGQTYLDISSQYKIPGLQGQVVYPPEMAEDLCKVLSDGNTYTIEEVCDKFGITLENRKMFRNYIDDLLKNNTATFITKKYSNLKRPLNVPKSHKYYNYYN